MENAEREQESSSASAKDTALNIPLQADYRLTLVAMATQRMVAAVLLFLLVGAAAPFAEGRCTIRNDSGQALVIVPTVQAAASVTVDVGAAAVLEGAQQHCYFRNPYTGHQKGPVFLASGRVYAIVDAQVQGEVNVCVASILSGVLNLGAVISAGI
ncbi:hypothetical protein KP509_22G075500 [Ceratopteris richardii]|uniref:Uncharacterized protein n=1 Tax=Ceratopteris richardii TaxID=49495 RepID=A0A8T2S8E0_CERRI|nr:hypothetical protein KP509_22G075500 [Ceratopteris richardii]